MKYTDEEFPPPRLLLFLPQACAPQIAAHSIKGAAGRPHLITAHRGQGMVEIAMLHRAGGITYRSKRCKNLRRKEAGKIAPEQENPCRGDDDEENKHSVDHRLPHRRRNAHLIVMPHHWNSACPHENNAAAVPLITKKQPRLVPRQCGAARPTCTHDRIPNVIGIGPIGQIEEAILHNRDADTRRLQQMNVTFNMIPFELLPLCGSTQRTQCKGNR